MDHRNINSAGERYHIKRYTSYGSSAVYYHAVPSGMFHAPAFQAFRFSRQVPGFIVIQRQDASRGVYHEGRKFSYLLLEDEGQNLTDVVTHYAEAEMQGEAYHFPFDDIPNYTTA